MRLPAMQRLRGNRRMTVLICFGEGIMQRTLFGRHYALVVVAIIFVALLAATFFICGFATNGLASTHMIALCHDHGLEAVAAGGLLAIMGFFDLVGTTASGWLTDRIDPRKLLFACYGLRGLSLFAVFYGLDWIATMPPTVALANRAFGTKKAPILFGWIAASHQIGAAAAAFFASASRTATGSYLASLVTAGFVAVGTAFPAPTIGTKGPGHSPVSA
jgi:hypothetical protein